MGQRLPALYKITHSLNKEEFTIKIKSAHIAYLGSFISGIILVSILQGSVAPAVLNGWLFTNTSIVFLRIWLSQKHPYPEDAEKNRQYRKILMLIGITLSGIVWASSTWLLFVPNDIVRQMFLIFILLGITFLSPVSSGSSFIAFLCFSQPIIHTLTARFIYEGESNYYLMAILTQFGNLSLISTSLYSSEIHRRLKKAKEAAEAASRTKSEFLANISHEVRTPINAIIGINYLLKQTPLTPQQLDYTDKSLIASNSLLGNIENILDYSKIETQEKKVRSSIFHLEEIINTVTTLVEIDVKKKDLTFTCHIEKDTTTCLKGDPVKIVQILSNLVKNAVKFTHKGSVRLTIRQLETAHSKVLIYFTVQDTGIGIRHNDYNKLFKPFSQVNSSHNRQYGGTGLGLCISQQLANHMGSKIELTSKPNEGSTFYFSLWLDQCLESENISCSLTPHSLVQTEDSQILPVFTGSSILLVEDDELSQHITSQLLTLLGIQVEVVGTAQQAFNSLKKQLPDLILLDIQMPLMDGYEAITIIRTTNEWKTIPVVCLTAHSSAHEKERSLNSGMDDFLTKPIDPIELHKVLLKWLPHQTSSESNKLYLTNSSEQHNSEKRINLKKNKSQIEISRNILNVIVMLEDKDSSMAFLKSTKESLSESRSILQHHLSNNDWKQASLCAHRLRGTTNFYASSALEYCLQSIDNQLINKKSVKETQQLLTTEFNLVEELITSMLDKESA